MNDIKLLVAQKLNNSTEEVKNIVINKYVSVEVERRSTLLFNSVEKLEELTKNFQNKLNKPDIEEYDVNLTKIVKYSKTRIEQINKEKEKIENLNKVIEKCLDENKEENYNKLDETLKKLKGGDKQEDKQS